MYVGSYFSSNWDSNTFAKLPFILFKNIIYAAYLQKNITFNT